MLIDPVVKFIIFLYAHKWERKYNVRFRRNIAIGYQDIGYQDRENDRGRKMRGIRERKGACSFIIIMKKSYPTPSPKIV